MIKEFLNESSSSTSNNQTGDSTARSFGPDLSTIEQSELGVMYIPVFLKVNELNRILKIKKQISSGSFGKVYLAKGRTRQYPDQIIVKMPRKKLSSKASLEEWEMERVLFLQEISIMASVRQCSFIASLLGYSDIR